MVTLRALPFALLAITSSTYAFAGDAGEHRSNSRLTCFAVRAGDTAARLAQRITGNMTNRHQGWFQIVDPVTATVIPKSRYDDIEPGWRVCIASEMLRGLPQPQYLPVSTAGVVAPQSTVPPRGPAVRPVVLWWVAPLFVAVSGVGLAWGWKQVDQRRARVDVLRRFGERFICEFERPLRRNATSPPVRSRVRFAPRRLRVDILVAPAAGRTYPNLVDHKRNVEYDVERVMRLLRDASFIHGPVYAQGSWVVIPCRFQTGKQQEGAS